MMFRTLCRVPCVWQGIVRPDASGAEASDAGMDASQACTVCGEGVMSEAGVRVQMKVYGRPQVWGGGCDPVQGDAGYPDVIRFPDGCFPDGARYLEPDDICHFRDDCPDADAMECFRGVCHYQGVVPQPAYVRCCPGGGMMIPVPLLWGGCCARGVSSCRSDVCRVVGCARFSLFCRFRCDAVPQPSTWITTLQEPLWR